MVWGYKQHDLQGQNIVKWDSVLFTEQFTHTTYIPTQVVFTGSLNLGTRYKKMQLELDKNDKNTHFPTKRLEQYLI